MRKKVSFTLRKHIHNPAYIDYKEVLKLIPKDWQKKIKQNTGLPLPDEVMVIKVMVFSTKRKWLKKNIAETQFKDLYRTLHQRKIIPQCQWSKYEGWQQQNHTQKLTQKQWAQLFLCLCKNVK